MEKKNGITRRIEAMFTITTLELQKNYSLTKKSNILEKWYMITQI